MGKHHHCGRRTHSLKDTARIYRIDMFPLRVGLLLVFANLAWWPSLVRPDCDSLAHIDVTCGEELQFFGNRNLKPSSTEQTFKDNCRTFEDGVKCLTDYSNKCLADRPGRMAKTIMRSVKDHYEKRCKDKDYGAEFMEHNKCFDDPAVFEQFHQCADRWYYRMQELGKQSWDVERGIQSSCCIFHEFQRCIREANVNVCHDRNARFWDDTLDEVSDDTVNIFCAQLKTPEECAQNFPADLWAAFNGPVEAMSAEALREKSGKFKSMFLTILDMISQYKLKA